MNNQSLLPDGDAIKAVVAMLAGLQPSAKQLQAFSNSLERRRDDLHVALKHLSRKT
jgi:hypothetical protein